MMIPVCPPPPPDAGAMRGLLLSVDCNTRGFSEAGYLALTGPGSIFPALLTALLTIYVALLGYRLLLGLGGLRLSDAPLIALKIGAILALTLNWPAFQTLVFDLGLRAPLEIGRIVAAPAAGGGHALASDPLAGVEAAHAELIADGTAFAKRANLTPQAGDAGASATAASLFKAAITLYMATAGVLAGAIIVVGILTAIGPLFIALFLFEQTRGLFVGWVRATVTAALAPLLCWVTTSLLLVVIEPGLQTLADQRQSDTLSIDSANAVVAMLSVFAGAQAALVIAGIIIASGFRLRPLLRLPDGRSERAPARAEAAVIDRQSRAERLAQTLQRPAEAYGAAGWSTLGGSGATAAPGGAAPAIAPAAAAPRAVRLGEEYRRGGFRDRRPGGRGAP